MPRYSKRFLETKHPTLYARRVKGDFVKLFKDHEAENGFYAFPLGHPQRPRHGRKWITINNFRYKLEWLPDAEPPVETYGRIGPGHPAYERVQMLKARNMTVCDSLDHNEVSGCSNPDCFKHSIYLRNAESVTHPAPPTTKPKP